MEIDKNISFFIETQFPAIYRENGRELIALVEEYYRWLETNENQSVYNARRIFEYRDIDTTLSKMLIFFKNKFLSDLPFNEEIIRFIIKNIMALYRRRGTTEGLKLFFKIFFQAEAKVYYPAKDILKPSASEWKVGAYLELFSNSGRFYSSELDAYFTYADLTNKVIKGSISKAEAIVDKVNIMILNNNAVPVLYLNNMKGKFVGFDDITTIIEGNLVNFGKVYGSATNIQIDRNFSGTSGNAYGDIFTVSGNQGIGAKVIASSVSQIFTGTIDYTIINGGFGYTKENTRLLVSNQNIKYTGNTNNSDFNILERVEDQFGNKAVVIGYNDSFVGFRLDANSEFSNTSNISTLDREVNFTAPASDIFPEGITEKNDTSPGPLYPEVGGSNSVKLDEISNAQTISLITDIIGDFANVALNSSNYNTNPPATATMSGNTDPVIISTRLDEAFDLTPFEIGTIEAFININPGEGYINDVFAVAYDPTMDGFDRFSQIVTLDELNAAMSIGEIIYQNGVGGIITEISGKSLRVIPYSYYGFNTDDAVTYKNSSYNVVEVVTDYSSREFGFNATIETQTEFAIGKIQSVEVVNSGFGYKDQDTVFLIDKNGETAARGTVNSRGTGITGGFWSSLDSHINGYVLNNEELDYFNASKYIQDSDFYQEYSYQIISNVSSANYSDLYKDTMHVAGTKFFSKFVIEDYLNESRDISFRVQFLDPSLYANTDIGSSANTANNESANTA